MPAAANVPSRAAEDYLKAVYKLQRSVSPVSTTALAGKLERSAASVTNMVKSLANQGLLEHVPYHGVSLTEAGELFALLIIRRHRVSELYLIEKLGYTAAALGDPDFDPHGAPIPTSEGTISERPLQRLLELQPGQAGVVRQVADNDSGRLLRLAKLGLRPGARVVRDEDVTPGQPFPLNVEGEAVSLDPDLVEAVFVERSDG
jgi:DtxR family Mn-dependent transcriptional regulator